MRYRITDTELCAAIQRLFDLNAQGWQMSGPEILNYIEQSGVVLGDSTDRAKEMHIAAALQRLGVEKTRTSTWRGYLHIRPKSHD